MDDVIREEPGAETTAAEAAAAGTTAAESGGGSGDRETGGRIEERPEGLGRIYLRRFRKHTLGKTGLAILIVLYFIALFADFLSPFSMTWTNKSQPYRAPTGVKLIHRGPGGRRFRPFTYETYIRNVALRTYGRISPRSIRAVSISNFPGMQELRATAQDEGAEARKRRLLGEIQRFYRLERDDPLTARIAREIDELEGDDDPDARRIIEVGRENVRGERVPRRLILARGNKNFLKLFGRGIRYSFLGLIETDRHLLTSRTGGFHPFGTDALGRDIASRLFHGSRVSLTVGLAGAAVIMVLGLLAGGISGYVGGITDTVLMRFTEVLIAIPAIYLLFTLRAALPGDLGSTQVYMLIVIITSVIGWSGIARVIRGQVLSIKTEDFVLSARTMGLSHLKIIIRHVLPSTFSYAVVQVTLSIPGFILGESALSLLGLGITEPQSSWGLMLAVGRNFRVVSDFPWVLIPGLFIFLSILAWNFFGDGVRDALDPRSRH